MNVGGFSHKESTSVDDNVAEQHTHTGMGDDTGKTGAASEGEKLQYKAEYQQHVSLKNVMNDMPEVRYSQYEPVHEIKTLEIFEYMYA